MKSREEYLRESFDKNIKAKYGVSLEFDEAKAGNGYAWIYEAMRNYTSEACKEQREICAKAYANEPADESLYYVIMNAPEPNII